VTAADAYRVVFEALKWRNQFLILLEAEAEISYYSSLFFAKKKIFEPLFLCSLQKNCNSGRSPCAEWNGIKGSSLVYLVVHFRPEIMVQP
jgi:hypothetical protein